MPNPNNILPPGDQDLLLAQKIGEALPDLDRLESEQDLLLNQLFSYRRNMQERFEPVDMETLWDSIQTAINTDNYAKISHLSPAIKRFAAAAAILIAAFVGSFLYQNFNGSQLIAESFGTIKKVELADGTQVDLRPYSRLFQESKSITALEYRLEGEAFFDVSYNPERVFSVSTERAKVEVLGTKFILSDWGNSSSVYLQEGRIQYEAISNRETIILEPGQSSTISDELPSPVLSDVDEMVFIDWLKGQLVFQNQPVNQVFNELEQHYNIKINRPADLDGETLSGSIQLDELSVVLRDLEFVLGGTFTQTGDNEYRFNPEG